MGFGLPGEDPGRLAREHGVATLLAGGMILDIIAPPGELFLETNDNSVAILLTYGTTSLCSLVTPRRGRST
jgi:hypothetical protein